MSYIERALEAAAIRARLRNPPNARLDHGIDLRRVKPSIKLRFMPWTAADVIEAEMARVESCSRREPICISIEDMGGFDAPPVPVILRSADITIIPTLLAIEARASYPPVPVIIQEVSKFYSVSVIDLMSARRTANIVKPRQVAMYLAKTLTLRSLPDIGRRLGGRDHTTVLHGVRKIESLLPTTDRLSDEIEILKLNIAQRMATV